MTREEAILFAGTQIVDSIDMLLVEIGRGNGDTTMTHTVVINNHPFTIHIRPGHCDGAMDIITPEGTLH